MTPKMFIHYDARADYLEIRFGKATPSYYEEIAEDVFVRRDEKTKKVKGYALFSVQKRHKNACSLAVPVSQMSS